MNHTVLNETLHLAVEMRLLDFIHKPKSQWPKPDDKITCPDCKGDGWADGDYGHLKPKHPKIKPIKKINCAICNGKGKISRKELYSQQIASYGDDLQFNGKNCSTAFNALAEAITMLIVFGKQNVEFNGTTFRKI